MKRGFQICGYVFGNPDRYIVLILIVLRPEYSVAILSPEESEPASISVIFLISAKPLTALVRVSLCLS